MQGEFILIGILSTSKNQSTSNQPLNWQEICHKLCALHGQKQIAAQISDLKLLECQVRMYLFIFVQGMPLYHWNLYIHSLEQLCVHKSYHKLISWCVWLTMWLPFAALNMLGISSSSIMCVRPSHHHNVIVTRLLSVFGQSPFVCVIVGIIITATFGPLLIAWLPYYPMWPDW